MSGNLCRCAAYVSIVDAVARAAGARSDEGRVHPATSAEEAVA